MSMNGMQQEVDDWVTSVGVRYFSELTNMGQLTEEVGEVARILIRTHGDQSFKKGSETPDLGDELADVIFSVICIANQHDIDLAKAWKKNMAKKTSRDAARHANNEKLSS